MSAKNSTANCKILYFWTFTLDNMSFIELFLFAAGLSMGAFAVAVCARLAMVKVNVKKH